MDAKTPEGPLPEGPFSGLPEKPATEGAELSGSDVGMAMRLSSEFVAGVITGSVLGWLADRYLGFNPWGLIAGTLLGFAAGMLNVMRVAGMFGPSKTTAGTSGARKTGLE